MGNCVHSQIHLVNQLTCSLNEPPERKTSKILNLQLQQVQVPKEIQNLLVSGIAENQGIRKKIFTNLSISGVFNLLIKSLISLSSVLLMPRERALRTAGALPNPRVHQLQETSLQIRKEFLSLLRAEPHSWCSAPLQRTNTVQIEGL